jgi:hypothetical protein
MLRTRHCPRRALDPSPLRSRYWELVIVADLVGQLLPSSEGDIAFGIVAALIAAVAAAGLWTVHWSRYVMTRRKCKWPTRSSLRGLPLL